MDFSALLTRDLLGNSMLQWFVAGGIALTIFVVLRVARGLVRGRLQRVAGATDFAYDDLVVGLLGRTRSLLILAAALAIAAQSLVLPARYAQAVDLALIVALLIQAAIWGNYALSYVLQTLEERDDIGSGRRTTLAAISFLGRLVLFTVLSLVALDTMGVDVTALIASLGIAGIAIGLALQNVVGDLFASLSIVLDKPFEIGDFVIVGEFMGTIEQIGLRTTRVRSLSGEQLVFTNNDLLQSRIRNYKRMQERRVVFTVGVTYDTDRSLLARLPDEIREVVEAQEQVRFDRSHFKGFGPSSLDFETVYWVLSADYNVFMDIQQAINLALVERFADLDAEFAFPTQTLHLHPGAGFARWGAGDDTAAGGSGGIGAETPPAADADAPTAAS